MDSPGGGVGKTILLPEFVPVSEIPADPELKGSCMVDGYPAAGLQGKPVRLIPPAEHLPESFEPKSSQTPVV
jgi:hypothetical protein